LVSSSSQIGSNADDSFPEEGKASVPVVTLVVFPSSGITGGCMSRDSANLQNNKLRAKNHTDKKKDGMITDMLTDNYQQTLMS
jgi:hypothetical protein